MGGYFSTISKPQVDVKKGNIVSPNSNDGIKTTNDVSFTPNVTKIEEGAAKKAAAAKKVEAATEGASKIAAAAREGEVEKVEAAREGEVEKVEAATEAATEGAEGAEEAASKTISPNTTKEQPEQVITNGKKYGDINFISWYCTVLSRFAYMIDKDFITYYYKVFGPVIPVKLLETMNDYIKTIDSAGDDLTYFLEDYKMFKTIPNYTAGNFKLSLGNDINLELSTHKHKYSDTEVGNYINFIPLSEIVNAVIDEIPVNLTPLLTSNQLKIIGNAKAINHANDNESKEIQVGGSSNDYLKYISIATSNYGEIYVSCDTRFPNMINVLFRGTYSPKTLASYSKITSAWSYTMGYSYADTEEKYLYGIFKLLADIIHTLFNAIIYLVETHLIPKINETDPTSKITLITTGHSLGGALTTIFSYVWAEHIRGIYENTKDDEDKDKPEYKTMARINKNIVCLSLAAPRVMNPDLANYFCLTHIMKDVYFKRLTTRGDPIPTQPSSVLNYAHPCSSSNVKSSVKALSSGFKNLFRKPTDTSTKIRDTHKEVLEKRKKISEDCDTHYSLSLNTNVPKYNSDLKCSNVKTNYIDVMDGLFHVIYLDISFRGAIYLGRFLAKYAAAWSTALTLTNITYEVPRTNDFFGSTVCRLVFYDGGKKTSNLFFSLDTVRNIPKTVASRGYEAVNPFASGKLVEDVFMNYKSFNRVIVDVNKNNFNLPIDKSPADKWGLSGIKFVAGKYTQLANAVTLGVVKNDTSPDTNRGIWIPFTRPKDNDSGYNTELTNFFMTNINKDGSKSKFGEGIEMTVSNKPPPSVIVMTKEEAQKDTNFEVPEKTDSAKTGGSRRIQKRSKQNKTNRRKGRRQNKSKRRNKIISKRHNKTRK
jgi:hypothetical protein